MPLPPDFTTTANQRFTEARRFWQNWRVEAHDDFAFISGQQWLADDEAVLKEQKRPPITFNYSEKMIDAVAGAEVSARQEITYKPRTLQDAPLAELWTNAAKWVRDQSNIEDEETDAFRDCLICGFGWTHTKVNYEEELDGMIETHRIDPLEMYPDSAATKPGLSDRRYSFRVLWIDEREARRQWPKATNFVVENPQAGQDIITQGHRYERDGFEDEDNHKDQVQVRHYECVELEPVYRAASPNGQIVELSPEEYAKIRSDLDQANIQVIKQFRRVYYYAYFAGDTLLEGDKSPCQAGFTYQCISGKRNRNKNTWYGLTKVMKDPQRWANKWLSQILHIINSNAKGGLLAEVGAFVDPQRAQDEWAMPESITLLREGGIGKIQQKQMTSYPSGLDRLMEFALSSLPQVTGINLEALGLAARDQPNVLEQSRKQAAYGLLAPIFDSLRRYRKNQGRVLLDFIHNYISDGRLIRIEGQDNQQFIPLTKAPKAPEYDIIVDSSPSSPDVKEKTWEALVQIVPAMLKAGTPIPPDILDYVPLPTALVMKWKQFAVSQQIQPQQMQQAQQQMQQLQQQNEQLQQQLRDRSAELQVRQQEVAAKIQLQQVELKSKLQLAQAELEGKLAIQQSEHIAKSQLAANQLQTDVALAQQKNDNEFAIAAQRAQGDISAKMHEVIQSGANEASANINDAINKLIETIGKLEADDQADQI